jgi:hypothetical protein
VVGFGESTQETPEELLDLLFGQPQQVNQRNHSVFVGRFEFRMENEVRVIHWTAFLFQRNSKSLISRLDHCFRSAAIFAANMNTRSDIPAHLRPTFCPYRSKTVLSPSHLFRTRLISTSPFHQSQIIIEQRAKSATSIKAITNQGSSVRALMS